jgi:molybdopterin-guanine dinucleotide biosynthesis protein A
MTRSGYAAVVLAGGAGRRLGGVVKPALRLGGRSLIDRVLAAVPDARPVVVVGPTELSTELPAGVLLTREEPPGGGPVAASAAGIALLPPEATYVALLAADLPFLTAEAVTALRLAATDQGVDGAVFVDEAGRRQSLCGVWRVAALTSRLAAMKAQRGHLEGASLRELLTGLRVAELSTTARTAGLGNTDGGSGAAGSGAAGSDETGTGIAGSNMRGSGAAGTDETDTDETGTGMTGSNMRGLGETGLGETDGDGLLGAGGATTGVGLGPPPWFDCDTEDDLRRGERWVSGDAG